MTKLYHMLVPAIAQLALLASPAPAHEGHTGHGAAGSPAEAVVFPSETLLAPNVPIVERDGSTGHFVDRFGGAGPVVISFTYTSCSTVCPVANAVLADVQGDLPEVTLMTVSVDPANDTPEAMAASAKMFGAGPDWHWVAASVADTGQLMAAFGVPRGPLEDHDPLFLVGDIGEGRFVRVVGLPAPDDLVSIVKSVTAP